MKSSSIIIFRDLKKEERKRNEPVNAILIVNIISLNIEIRCKDVNCSIEKFHSVISCVEGRSYIDFFAFGRGDHSYAFFASDANDLLPLSVTHTDTFLLRQENAAVAFCCSVYTQKKMENKKIN